MCNVNNSLTRKKNKREHKLTHSLPSMTMLSDEG